MQNSEPIRVVLADDHSMVREALARILDDSGDVSVVGQASDGLQVIEIIDAAPPQCVVLDYSMPNLDAPAVIETLTRRYPDIRVLVLTVHENIHYAIRALESGAHGYMIKSAAANELVEAIQVVTEGGIYISPKVSSQVLKQLKRPRRERVGLEALSQREFDLLRILGAGKSLQECAQHMKVSTSTASTYRSRVMEKLNLSSTAELIRFALEHDVVG